ncbi:hypothetical protein TNCV_729801 [Trichonephila clavipes]|nr:hypothetical protein TNCV_729801 [Trichonephila clavipes]
MATTRLVSRPSPCFYQNTSLIGTKAESTAIRKHNRSPLRLQCQSPTFIDACKPQWFGVNATGVLLRAVLAVTDISKKFPQFQFSLAAPAREDCVLLLAACHNGQPDCTLSAAVRLPFSFFIETRGESETYKKDETDKDYTTNT